MPPEHVWTYVVYANLADISREWWAIQKKNLLDKYDCKVSYRKARHTENNMWIPYRLTVRGIEAMHCSEELLDVLCIEQPAVIEPWDIEAVPILGEGHELAEQKHGKLQGLVFKLGGGQAAADNELRNAFLATTVKWGKTYVEPKLSALSKETVKRLLDKVREQRAPSTTKPALVADDQPEAPLAVEDVSKAGLTAEDPSHALPTTSDASQALQAGLTAEDKSQQLKQEAKTETADEEQIAFARYATARHEWLVGLRQRCREDMKRHGYYFSEKFQKFDQESSLPDYNHHVCFCMQSFKRTFQFVKAICLNVATTWQFRRHITWIITDFNEDEAIADALAELVPIAVIENHVRYCRSETPFQYYDCSVAKNTAHMATQALTGKAFPADMLYVVNVDNDNVVTQEFCVDVLKSSFTELQQPCARVATQWVSKDLGTYGRIGMPFQTFVKMGGYDEGMKGMGAQDCDILWRAALIGHVETKQVPWSGLSVPNQEDKLEELLGASDKSRRKAWSGERDVKMLNVDPDVYQEFHGSYDEMNQRNNKRAKNNRKQNAWRQNQALSMIGVPVAETELRVDLLKAHGLLTRTTAFSAEPLPGIGLAGAPAASSSSQPSHGGVGPEVQEAGPDRQKRLRAEEERLGQEEERRLAEEAEAALRRGELACAAFKRRRLTDEDHVVTGRSPPQLICSMGTRTLAYSFPANPHAKLLKDGMWPKDRSAPRAAFDEALAIRALLGTGHMFTDVELFWWIDCTRLSGFTGDSNFDRQGHVGMHERIQVSCVRHRAFEEVLRGMGQAATCIADGKRVAVVFWCNAGEHRSVACAEAFARWLQAKFPSQAGNHVVRHFCSDQWGRRGCGFWRCTSCREHSELRVAVDQELATRMRSFER